MIKLKRRQYSSPFNRSEHMKLLHSSGRYAGTSKIGLWNISDERKRKMAELRTQNALNKSSHGYGSEYHMRILNREHLHNKFQGESGYFYFLDFPNSVKVGFSKDWERRTTKQILGGRVIMIISGPTSELADLEFDAFMKFEKYTQLNSDKTRYTEFLDKRCKRDMYKYLEEKVQSSQNLKFEIKNIG